MISEQSPKTHAFIGVYEPLNPLGEQHDLLMANLFGQSEALATHIAAEINHPDATPLTHDSSTNALIRRYRRMRPSPP